jgi:hypothetical protein
VAVALVLDCPFLHLYNKEGVNPRIMTATPFLTHAPSLELDTVDFTHVVALILSAFPVLFNRTMEQNGVSMGDLTMSLEMLQEKQAAGKML